LRATEPDPGALSFIVLAAGRGLRMGVVGEGRPKALLPVLGRPLIDWQLEALRAAGLSAGTVVVGHQASALRAHLGDGSRFGLRLGTVTQERPEGIAHAIACAAPELRGPFVCLLGDTWVQPAELGLLCEAFQQEHADGALALLPEADAATRARNYAVTLEEVPGRPWTRITAVEEKPRDGRSGPAGIGLYAFRPTFLEAARTTRPSALRGEREITDAIAATLAGGARFVGVALTRPDFNLSGPADLLALNQHVLGASGRSTWVADDAIVEPEVELVQAVVGARATIARGVRLERAVVLADERVPAGDYAGGVFAGGRWVGTT
jgi:dTDP-glucose pyrophosphorylase